jgi:hypothetical protein
VQVAVTEHLRSVEPILKNAGRARRLKFRLYGRSPRRLHAIQEFIVTAVHRTRFTSRASHAQPCANVTAPSGARHAFASGFGMAGACLPYARVAYSQLRIEQQLLAGRISPYRPDWLAP